MKHTKDRMTSLMPVAEMNQLLDIYKTTGANLSEIATVIGHPNFISHSKQWADAIHAHGMNVTWRCAHINMEGLYNQPAFVGANRKPVQFWIDEAVKAVGDLGSAIQPGDEWAIYPERTEGIFNDNSAWLYTGLPSSYGTAFLNIHTACKSILPTGVIVGLSSNNASEYYSRWMPRTLSDYSGVVAVDLYEDGNPTNYENNVRSVYRNYGKPVYVQEGVPNRFTRPTRAQADEYFAANKRLEAEGILCGFGSWSGWAGNPESIIDRDATGRYYLNDSGLALQAWWVPPLLELGPEQPSPESGAVFRDFTSKGQLLGKIKLYK